MVSKMQLEAVGQMCPGYDYVGQGAYVTSSNSEGVSCETCVHWVDQRCDIDLFDKVLTGLDQE